MHAHVPTEAFLRAITAGQKFSKGAQRDTYIHALTSQAPQCDSHPSCCHPRYCRSSLLPCTRVHQIGSKLLRDEPLVPKETLQNEGARATGSSFAAPPTSAFFSFLPRELFAGGREGCLNSSADPFSKVNMQLCKSP